jgi:hypothetical protein
MWAPRCTRGCDSARIPTLRTAKRLQVNNLIFTSNRQQKQCYGFDFAANDTDCAPERNSTELNTVNHT